MKRAFEVSLKSALCGRYSVLASSQAEADTIGRELSGDDFMFAHDVRGVSDGWTIVAYTYNRAKRAEEWLVRSPEGVEVHAYSYGSDSLFPQCRFRGNVPGYGGAGWTLREACWCASRMPPQEPRDWFSRGVAMGRDYFGTALNLETVR